MERSMKKTIIRQITINVMIVVLALVIFKGVSYSMDNDLSRDNKDVLIKTGNMQVVLNTSKDQYKFNDILKNSVSDIVGMKQDGYNFSIINTGNIPIEYYEIRLVDQENKVSTLPHKYLRFTIKDNNDVFTKVNNLGDMDSIIYSGYDLKVNESNSFNLKLWIDNNSMDYADKELFLAIEVTLYQKYDVYDNYVLYDGNGSVNVPIRTPLFSPITSFIPEKNGYEFLGWSSKKDGEVEYLSNTSYHEDKGKTLYAVWKKI